MRSWTKWPHAVNQAPRRPVSTTAMRCVRAPAHEPCSFGPPPRTRRARRPPRSQVWLVRITPRGAGSRRRCGAGRHCIGSAVRGGSGGIRRHADPPMRKGCTAAMQTAAEKAMSDHHSWPVPTRQLPVPSLAVQPSASAIKPSIYLHAAKSHTSPAAYLPSGAKDVTRMRPLKARPDSSFWAATAPSTLANSRKTHPRPRVRPASGS